MGVPYAVTFSTTTLKLSLEVMAQFPPPPRERAARRSPQIAPEPCLGGLAGPGAKLVVMSPPAHRSGEGKRGTGFRKLQNELRTRKIK